MKTSLYPHYKRLRTRYGSDRAVSSALEIHPRTLRRINSGEGAQKSTEQLIILASQLYLKQLFIRALVEKGYLSAKAINIVWRELTANANLS